MAMRNSSSVDRNNRPKFTYSDEPQHLDPIAEYDDELNLEYGAEEDVFDDNETVDEEEFSYIDNDQYVIENHKRYIKARDGNAQPTRAKYIYKKKEVESLADRSHRKPSTKTTSYSPLSPVNSKSKFDPSLWSKPINPVSSYQRSIKIKKPEGPKSALLSLNALREKMFGLSKTQASTMPSSESQPPAMPTHHSKSKRRNTISTEQIHHDSGDGPRNSEPYNIKLSNLLKMNDDSAFSASMGDNEIIANLVNDISSMQSETKRKIRDMDRQKHEADQYYTTSLNIDNFREQLERKNEAEQHKSFSSNYQPFTNHSLGGFPHNILESLNFPLKKNSTTQTNLGLEDVYMSDQGFKPESETKYGESCGHDDNQNWNEDDVSNIVSSSKEDLTELRNLQKTKRMICELINKEIEKIAKMKNLDMSVSRRFLLQDRESLCNEDFRKTRLETLNNLGNEIKKLITLETGYE